MTRPELFNHSATMSSESEAQSHKSLAPPKKSAAMATAAGVAT
jgi:hypothetical protein